MQNNCTNCPYNICGRITSITPSQNDLLIVGTSPNNEELKHNLPFAGRGGTILQETLLKAQLPEPAKTLSLLCKVIDDKKPSKVAIINCRERLVNEIHIIKPKLIISLGNIALQALQNDYKLKIGHAISVPIQWVEDSSVIILPNYHPAKLLKSPGDYQTFLNCFLYAKELLDGKGQKDPGITKYVVIENEEQAKACVEFLVGLPSSTVISCDIETLGKKITTAQILCVGFCYAKNKVIIYPSKFLHYIKYILENCSAKFDYQRGQFDTGVFNWQGIHANIDHDTILLHYCLNENVGKHDLDILSRLYLGAGNYKDEISDMSRMDLVPKPILYRHNALDCDYGLQLLDLFLPEVENKLSTNLLYHQILIPGVNFLRRVTQTGFMIDQPYLSQYKTKLNSEIVQIKENILANYGHLYDRNAYLLETGAKSAPVDLNIGSHYQLAWLLYDRLHLHPTIHTKVERSTDKDVLGSLYDDHPIIPELLKYSTKTKLMNTYVEGIEEKIDEDGKLHGTFSLQTTVTGRLSSEKPNLQNIPRDKEVKNIFTVPNGKLLIEADYKGLELRVLAHVSQDAFLIDCFQKGLDLHDEMSKAIFGPKFTKEQRVRVKGINFGIPYGREAFSIAQEFNMSLREAKYMIEEWFEKAPGAKAYMDACEKQIKDKIPFVTPFGRNRRFGVVTGAKHQNNEGRNFAIQSIGSDLLLLSAIKLEYLIKPFGAIIINLVHDSILIEASNDKENVEHIIKLIREIMNETPTQWLHPIIPFPVEVSVGFSWGEMKDIKLAASEGIEPPS